jgi:hypothetical protein
LAFSPDSSTLYIISVVADFSGVTYLVTAIDPVTGILKEIAGAPNPLVLLTVPQGGQAMINMAADGSTLFAFLFCTTTDPNTGCVSSTVDKIDVTTGQFVPFTIPDHFGFGLTPDGRGAVRRRNQPIAIWPRGQPH